MFRLSTLACVACALQALAAQPDLILHATVTRADYQTYKPIPFTVPPGVSRVTVEFSYTTKEQRTTIDLGLYDSERFRGWSGGNKSSFTVSATDATPSYLPGLLPAGEWKLLLGVPNIREGVTAQVTANIYFARIADAVNSHAGWYRGDLHMHTAHSDGSCQSQSGKRIPCPVYKTLEAAVARGLDFISVTDHNTTSHYDAVRELQPYFDRLLLILGREITTFQGHANVFGTVDFIDFRLGGQTVPAVADLLRQVQDQQAIISINHPGAPSGENCMGCGWTVNDTDFKRVQAIEAVNAGITDGQYSGIPFWEARLKEGFRLTAVGGSDNHDASKALDQPGSIGYPTTVVRAEELSEQGILDGIRAGHVFIDAKGSKDRFLEMTAKADASIGTMGDNLKAPAGVTVAISIHVAHVSGARIEIIKDGQSQNVLERTDITMDDETKTAPFTSDGAKHWIRANVRSSSDEILLLGNPVYLNY